MSRTGRTRVVIVSVAALAGLGALAFVAARIAGAFGQLHAVAVVQPAHAPSLSADGAAVADGAVVANAEPPAEVPAATAPPGESGRDEHILRALAADPEFARAADELLNDPDPQTRADAQQLLRDLGVHEVPVLRFRFSRGAGVTVEPSAGVAVQPKP